MIKTDVAIIGAGVNGCAIARELSRYKLDITVIDRCSDVCEGTSKANSGIIHSGYDAKSGTLMAKLNVRGNLLMHTLSKELDIPFKKNGSLVLCFSQEDMGKLEELKERGEKNKVPGLKILSRDEVLKKEPNISDNVYAALWAPTGSIACPFIMTVAFAENAIKNGAKFMMSTLVTDVSGKENDGYVIKTSKGEEIEADIVINAAGVYADAIHNMVSKNKIKITPRKGEYILYDKNVGNYVTSTLFQLPTALGKGTLVTPTVHGNLMTGPTAEDIRDKEGTDTTAAGTALLKKKAVLSVKEGYGRNPITEFAGLRATLTEACELNNFEDEYLGCGDFMIGEVKDAPGFIDVAGMGSPGLSCAPATAEYVRELVGKIKELKEKEDFNPVRKGIKAVNGATEEEIEALIKEDPRYANIICRCERVSEAEIVQAIHSILPATTLDAIKRRTRAGMGRCQSGFCNPRVVEILARELGVDESEINKAQDGSYYVLSKDAN
ncbi:MAG: NAD(P)/FAD-dependent oxidoreductase [Lachnospiraceae bacterium]|nr:NAD(P)/FAD-dependent oxidoreductase [Lachnospiraceae bacterium]